MADGIRNKRDVPVLINHHLPTLWDPQQLFFYLAVRAGLPAVVMAVAAALLGLYKSVQSWIALGKSTAEAGRQTRSKVNSWTTSQQRALVRWIVFSILAVAFSYMLAVIIDAVVRLISAHPNSVYSLKDLMNRV